ncbi:MAG: GNAT family N-acetyltransferase [Actinobacteria bacterium]|nr:GNAT family N-acetyltransferase [Actinomycetota bacterium]
MEKRIPEIKRARKADLRDILDIQKSAFQGETDQYYNGIPIPPLEDTIEDITDEFSRMIFLKAVEGGELVGSIRAYKKRDTCFIEKLIVKPGRQNAGIGKMLMREVEKLFPAAHRYELFTGNRSERNIHLYESLGYRIFKREPINNGLELVFMEKR